MVAWKYADKENYSSWKITLDYFLSNFGTQNPPIYISIFYKECLDTWSWLASHTDVLTGSSHIPAPRTPAEPKGKKSRPITVSTLPDLGSALWTLRNFALDFGSRKDQKGLMTSEYLTVLEQTSQLTHTPLY